MFFPETGYEGWTIFPHEEEILALRQDCHESMEATIQRLHAIVAQAPLPEAERNLLFYQLSHIQQHLRESVNLLLADSLLRTN